MSEGVKNRRASEAFMKTKGATVKLPEQTTFGDELVNSFKDFFARTERGKPITLRTVSLDLRIQEHSAEEIQKIRQSLNISQAVMAKLLGVSVLTIQSWEQGTRKPSQMACRFLDDIARSPAHWKKRLLDAVVTPQTA
jgi:putative transcriptional regulator